MELTKEYWQNRYREKTTRWDIGYPSPALIEYAESGVEKNKSILIPGAGNAHEAEYLFTRGYSNLFVVDWAKQPLVEFSKRVPSFPKKQLIQADFFELQMRVDIVLEQTFFCALPPSMREKYVLKMSEIIKAGGRLAGLLFNFPLTEKGPPFGGSKEEYEALFTPTFEISQLDLAKNSIPERQGNELFFELLKS